MTSPSPGAKPPPSGAWDRFLARLDTLAGATPRPLHRPAPDNTHSGEPNMAQHITDRGHEAIVREDWERDTLHVILRRTVTRTPDGPAVQYAWPHRVHIRQGTVTELTDWVSAPTSDNAEPRDDTPSPGIMFRRDDAKAIHSALGEALGYDATAEVADLQARLAELGVKAGHLEWERDQARAEAVANGARSAGYAATLHATQETLALVREWHTDTRRRLEQAENPALLVPATMEALEDALSSVCANDATDSDQASGINDTWPVGTQMTDDAGDVWEKVPMGGQGGEACWTTVDRDTRPHHRLAWVVEQWGPMTNPTVPTPED